MVTLAVEISILIVLSFIIYRNIDSIVDWLLHFLKIKKSEQKALDSERSMLQKKIDKLNDLKESLIEMEMEKDITEQLKNAEDKISELTNRIIEIDNKRR